MKLSWKYGILVWIPYWSELALWAPIKFLDFLYVCLIVMGHLKDCGRL